MLNLASAKLRLTLPEDYLPFLDNPCGGAKESRTLDLLLARQAL